MEGADNMAYICNTESLKEEECGRVLLLLYIASRLCSPFSYVVLSHPLTSSLFLSQRFWIPHRGFVTLFIRLINSLSFPCSLFADFNTGETRDTVRQD